MPQATELAKRLRALNLSSEMDRAFVSSYNAPRLASPAAAGAARMAPAQAGPEEAAHHLGRGAVTIGFLEHNGFTLKRRPRQPISLAALQDSAPALVHLRASVLCLDH